ncbi:hypothetical protein C2845_PM11G16490 [Panicum miliaceum]|uniref:Uncharacterized protein n=1 Tax=Panicum miliaceum TaxID=4540 RepID=A0A3L6RW42_PANMI|nr:hypothetical protein C2845_PM11G16490 [Panicum miliaceum]
MREEARKAVHGLGAPPVKLVPLQEGQAGNHVAQGDQTFQAVEGGSREVETTGPEIPEGEPLKELVVGDGPSLSPQIVGHQVEDGTVTVPCSPFGPPVQAGKENGEPKPEILEANIQACSQESNTRCGPLGPTGRCIVPAQGCSVETT